MPLAHHSPLTRVMSLVALCLMAVPAWAQTSPPAPLEQCTVQIGNRTTRVLADGTWELNDIPAIAGRVRARLVCDDGVTVRRGEGPLLRLVPNKTLAHLPIAFGAANPAPTDIALSGVPAVLSDTTPIQLTVTGVFPGSVDDITASDAGTDYTTSSDGVLSVDTEGLLTPLQSGNALITVVNQGITATLQVRIMLGEDSDGDGLPDDWETANGLDPNDPTDAMADSDADDLTNTAEYLCGTDPFATDTDADGLSDGEEVIAVGEESCELLSDPRAQDSDGDLVPDAVELMTSTLPLDPESYDLDAALLSLEAQPEAVYMVVGNFIGDSLSQLTLIGTFLDGSGADLTAHPEVIWSSLNASVISLTVNPGELLALAPGETLVLTGVGSHSLEIPASVSGFTPTALGRVTVTGHATNVALGPGIAAVSTSHGLAVLVVSPGGPPSLLSELSIGDCEDVKLRGPRAYLACSAGLVVVDLSDGASPTVAHTVTVSGARDLDIREDGLLALAAGSEIVMFELAEPAAPVEVGSVSMPGDALGVAIDGDAGVVALGSMGVAGISLADPTTPVASSTVPLGGADGRDVDMAGALAVVAVGNTGMATVDMSDPMAPVHLTNTGRWIFMLRDVALDGALALGADWLRVNEVPIVSVESPEAPFLTGLVDFSSFADDNGFGVDAREGIVALTTTNSRVYIGVYAVITDDKGVPPAVALTSPEEGAFFIEGEPIPITAFATDDVAVARIEFFVDGALVGVRQQAPYTYNLSSLPAGTVAAVHAEAVDLGENRGLSQIRTVAVVADPLTTVAGRVLDAEGVAVEGATVDLLPGTLSTLTAADGTFEVEGMATVLDIRAVADKVLSGVCDQGTCGEVYNACTHGTSCQAPHFAQAGPTTPVRGGVTDLGDMVIEGGSVLVIMTGVTARPWTFTAYDAVDAGAPATLMTGVTARPWTFTAYDAVDAGAPVTLMTGVTARPWTFTAYDAVDAGAPATLMTGVTARPWTFTSVDPEP